MDVHDVLNVFQVTGLNQDGKYYMYRRLVGFLLPGADIRRKACPAQPGDYFEFFAELDVLCALSTCPGGDLSKFGWGGTESQAAIVDCCRPLQIEIYDIEGKGVLHEWRPPAPASYRGNHGMP